MLSLQGLSFMIFLVNIGHSVHILLGNEKMSFSTHNGREKLFKLFQSVCLSAYFLVLSLIQITYNYSLLVCMIAGWTCIILETFYKTPSDLQENERIAKITIKYATWTQLLLIALKIDTIITFSWIFVLSPLILVAFIFGMLSIIFLFIFISTVCGNACYSTCGKPVILGSAWYLLTSLSIALWGLITIFDQSGSSLLVFGFILSILLVFYTRIFKEELLLFLKYETLDAMEELKNLLNTDYEVRYYTKEATQSKYLNKVTSTYYSVDTTDAFMNKKLMSENIRSPISKKYHKSASLDLEASCKDLEQKSNSFENGKESIIKIHSEHEEQESCFVCENTEANAVVMTCGHGGICHECAMEGWKKSDKCHICRGLITRVLKVKNIPGLSVVKILNETEKVFVKQELSD